MTEAAELSICEDTAEKGKPVKENPPLRMDLNDKSASPEAAEQTEAKDHLRLFVTLLTTRLLTRCHSLQNRGEQEWISHAKRLINETMAGFTVAKEFFPSVKKVEKLSKKIVKELRKKFTSSRVLESLMLLQDPDVDAAIIESIRAHIAELSEKKRSTCLLWTSVKEVLIFSGVLLLITLLLLIP